MGKIDIEKISKKMEGLFPLLARKILKELEHQSKNILSPLASQAVIFLSDEGSMTMSELARQLKIGKSQLTPISDKLINLDLVLRERDPEDRRIVKIKLTEEGLKMAEKFHEDTQNRIKEKIKILSDEELNSLSDAIDIFHMILNKI